jgi:DNA adenine methylase
MTNKGTYYTGNKNLAGLIQKIINQVPSSTEIYDLFCGSAAVSLKLSVGCIDIKNIHLNDIDPSVTDKYAFACSTVTNIPALDIVQSLIALPVDKSTFCFIDPPYLHETRTKKNHYNHEMTRKDHLQLLRAVRYLKCNVMVIHPVCPLYDWLLSDFRQIVVKIRYNNKTSIEKIYMNYPEPENLHVKSYTGSDCWDRQRIKRKGDRLINKIEALPAQEKNYILSRIAEKFI